MRHIKVKMLLFTVSAVMLTCVATNVVSISILRSLYMQELYSSSKSTARQILLTSDTTVNTVESSMTLILDSRGINTLLTQTDFRKENGDVFLAIQDLDSIMDNFKIQFEKFRSLLFCSSEGGMYRYHYYNGSMISYMNRLQGGNRQRYPIAGGNFRWEGVYKIGNELSPPGRDDSFVVTKTVLNPTNMKYAGLAVGFFEPDLFTANFSDVEKQSGGRVILLDANGRPAAGYNAKDLLLIAETRNRMDASDDRTLQFLTEDNSQMATVIRSEATGWMLLYLMPLQLLTEKVNTSILVGTAVATLLLCVTLFFVYRYVNALSSSIRVVSHAMSKVGSDDFSLRLQTGRDDEIGNIYKGFNTMSENLSRLFHKAVEEEREKKEAEIRALFYQIKPHFLYNTLASIRMYAMMEGAERIASMLATLNRLLRNTINSRDQTITVDTELQNLKDYIEIYRLRYKDRICFEVEPDEETRFLKIPNMIIQPVVENAIEHAFTNSLGNLQKECKIQVGVKLVNGDILITVVDNGEGMSDITRRKIFEEGDKECRESSEGHIGLKNIHERLLSLCGEGYGVSVESEKNKYTRIILKVRINHAEDSDC